MKHIIPYQAKITESHGRGSVLLIKGKEERGQRKLFATTILGSSEFKPGVMMYFLPNDFYRIVEEGGVFKARKVNYNSEASLKAVLNIKSPDRISIVGNNNKTPLHWKTLKHSHIMSAIKEVESDIRLGDYLLESTELYRDKNWNLLWNAVVKRTLRTVFMGLDEADVIETHVGTSLSDTIDDARNSGTTYGEYWDIDFRILYKNRDIRHLIAEFGIGQPVDVTIGFASDFTLSADKKFNFVEDDYDDHIPLSLESIKTYLDLGTSYVGGSEGIPDRELLALAKDIDAIVKNFGYIGMKDFLKKTTPVPIYKKGE